MTEISVKKDAYDIYNVVLGSLSVNDGKYSPRIMVGEDIALTPECDEEIGTSIRKPISFTSGEHLKDSASPLDDKYSASVNYVSNISIIPIADHEKNTTATNGKLTKTIELNRTRTRLALEEQ